MRFSFQNWTQVKQDEFDMVRGVLGAAFGHLDALVDLIEPKSPAWDEVMSTISGLADLPLLLTVD